MVKRIDGLSRDLIIHPGETLKEMLEDREMSQRELAIRTDVTEKHISNIVNCKKPISISFAKKLEYALEISSGFWINLQSNYDKELSDIGDLLIDYDFTEGAVEDKANEFARNILNTHNKHQA